MKIEAQPFLDGTPSHKKGHLTSLHFSTCQYANHVLSEEGASETQYEAKRNVFVALTLVRWLLLLDIFFQRTGLRHQEVEK
jgi:hypothetical protein